MIRAGIQARDILLRAEWAFAYQWR